MEKQLGTVSKSVIQEFIKRLPAGRTRDAKANDLCKYQAYMNIRLGRMPLVADINLASMQDCISYYLDVERQAPATVARLCWTLRHFEMELAKWLKRETFAKQIKPPTVPPRRPQHLSADEVTNILRTAHEIGRIDVQDRNVTLIQLQLATGLRAEEICALNLGNLTPSLDYLEAVRTKGRKYRRVYIPKTAREPLQQYLKLRADKLIGMGLNPLSPTLPLFLSARGGRLSYDGLKHVCKSIGKKVGVRYNSHRNRHTFCDRFHRAAGNDLPKTQAAMGHSSPVTTARFYLQTEPDEIADIAEQMEAM